MNLEEFIKKKTVLLLLIFGTFFHLLAYTYIPQVKKENSRKEFDYACQCQSMFTIGGCNIKTFAQDPSRSKIERRALMELNQVRAGAPRSLRYLLHQFSREMPTIHDSSSLTNSDGSLQKYPYGSSSNSSEFDRGRENEYMKYSDFHLRLPTKLPLVPCAIHAYSNEEIKTCLQKRQDRIGRPLRLAFVGDSEIRSVIEQMILQLESTLHLKINEISLKNIGIGFLDQPLKIDIPVRGDGIEIRLYWSTFLGRSRVSPRMNRQGARDLLTDWSFNKSTQYGEDVPDLLYFDDGNWISDRKHEVDNIDTVRADFDEMVPILKNLSRFSRLIYRTSTPFKKWAAKAQVENTRLDINDQLAWLKLPESGVWIWDTITPLYLKEIDECENHWKTGFAENLPKSWACTDFAHISKVVEHAASNMLWNYLCNDIMELNGTHCCSKSGII